MLRARELSSELQIWPISSCRHFADEVIRMSLNACCTCNTIIFPLSSSHIILWYCRWLEFLIFPNLGTHNAFFNRGIPKFRSNTQNFAILCFDVVIKIIMQSWHLTLNDWSRGKSDFVSANIRELKQTATSEARTSSGNVTSRFCNHFSTIHSHYA